MGYLLISIWADSTSFIVLRAVDVGTVVERPVLLPDWSATLLVKEVPVEARVRTMMCAFVLQEVWTLLCAKLLQIPKLPYRHTFGYLK